jgi:hypothetical protein
MGLPENGVAIGQITAVYAYPWTAGQTGPPTIDGSKAVGNSMQEFEIVPKAKAEPTRAAAYQNAITGYFISEKEAAIVMKGDQLTPNDLALAAGAQTANSGNDVYDSGLGGVPGDYILLVTGLVLTGPSANKIKTLWVPKLVFTPDTSYKGDFKQIMLGYKAGCVIDGSASYPAQSVPAPLLWYLVDTPVVAPTTLLLAASNPITPADTATGVAIGIAPTVAFRQVLNGLHVNGSNFFLVRDDTDALVPATVGFQDSAHLVVQITPTSNLVSGKKYRLVVAPNRVADIYGNVFAGSVTYFTCA